MQEVNITVNGAEFNTVMQALQQLPYGQVKDLIEKLITQVKAQVESTPAA